MVPRMPRLPSLAAASKMGRLGLSESRPMLERAPPRPAPRWASTTRPAHPLSARMPEPLAWLRLMSNPTRPSTAQAVAAMRMSYGTVNGVPRNQLATSEANANRDPSNANLQNAFYSLLMRANMPGIVVSRYQSGRFASNGATDEIYNRALAAANEGAGLGGTFSGGHQSVLDPAIGNALSHSMGGSDPSRGVKGKPVYVVLEESTASLVFRWFKFLASFVVFTWLCFSAVTILIEVLSSFRRPSTAKNDSEVTSEKQTARFSDVHGCGEAKDELEEVVEFLRQPEKFSDLGAKLPKGVLLVGPPGTGKTLLARAVAGEAGVPFFYMSGSEFDEIFVGVGAKRVRDLFSNAKAKSPAIIFIDELDAIGGKRNPRDQAHAKQTLNQLLTELDGFDQDARIVVIAATNTPNMLDKALTRPGRFDRHVNVDLPDLRGRLDILRHHAKKLKLATDVNLEAIAARSPGRSGAELENMLNVAALRASRARASIISRADLEWAFDRVTMGSEKKSMVITEKEKEMTAYHEAGHALVQLFDKESSSSLYKVTILPKGPSLGHTAFVPQMDKYSHTAAEYMSNIRVALGGKMAEELQYGDDKVTSGVSSDLENATDLCFAMVAKFGMSTVLGPVEYGKRYEHLSSDTRSKIETEVQTTLKKSYSDVKELLTLKRKELDLLAQALVKYETLDKSEVERVIRGESLPDRPIMSSGPMLMPLPADAPEPPLGGVHQPQPSDTEAPPPVAAGSTSGRLNS